MGVLESGDGTVTQAPRDGHQCVEILQLVKPLGREGDAEMVGITWGRGKMGVPMTAFQLNWGVRHVWVWATVSIRWEVAGSGVAGGGSVRKEWAASRCTGITWGVRRVTD